MNRPKSFVAAAIVACTVLVAVGPAAAKLHPAELGLAGSQMACDAGVKGKYHYVARWKAAPGVTSYKVYSGNQCKVGTCATGTATTTFCPATCKGGSCSVTLQACRADTGTSQWVKVLGTDDGWEKKPVLSPGKCQ